MLCPRCQVPVVHGQCPSCGIIWDPEEDSEDEGSSPHTPATVIEMEMSASQPTAPEDLPPSHWRNELRRRLEIHASKGLEAPGPGAAASPPVTSRPSVASVPAKSMDPDVRPPQNAATTTDAKIGEAPPKLFDYQLKAPKPEVRRQLDNPVRPAENTPIKRPRPVFERPLPKAQDPRSKPPLGVPDAPGVPVQKLLALEPPQKEAPPPDPAAQPGETISIPVSREILVSRFLAGVVDLCFAGFQGIGLGLIAAVLVPFDFFSPEGFRITAASALAFYFLNSVFFLLARGQTPGMQITRLSLRRDEDDNLPSVAGILLRIALFLPCMATVVGLFWALIDPARRCLHDILSGTQVDAPSPPNRSTKDRRSTRRSVRRGRSIYVRN